LEYTVATIGTDVTDGHTVTTITISDHIIATMPLNTTVAFIIPFE
jgi:hypothetical protein